MSIDVSTPDRTAAIRHARMDALKPQVSRDAMIERTNALTRAVHELMAQPPQDRWALDCLVTSHSYRDLVEVGRAVVRLVGEAWLTVADTHDQPC